MTPFSADSDPCTSSSSSSQWQYPVKSFFLFLNTLVEINRLNVATLIELAHTLFELQSLVNEVSRQLVLC